MRLDSLILLAGVMTLSSGCHTFVPYPAYSQSYGTCVDCDGYGNYGYVGPQASPGPFATSPTRRQTRDLRRWYRELNRFDRRTDGHYPVAGGSSMMNGCGCGCSQPVVCESFCGSGGFCNSGCVSDGWSSASGFPSEMAYGDVIYDGMAQGGTTYGGSCPNCQNSTHAIPTVPSAEPSEARPSPESSTEYYTPPGQVPVPTPADTAAGGLQPTGSLQPLLFAPPVEH